MTELSHKEVCDTLMAIRPGSEFSVVGNVIDTDSYSTSVTWIDEPEDGSPSWEEVFQNVVHPSEVATDVNQSLHMEVEKARLSAFRDLADPLFFKWQRGEATEQEWLDCVSQIRELYPYPTQE